MMIDISKGYRQYSPTELREYAYKNLLVAGKTELGDFLEYIFTDYEDKIERVTNENEQRRYGSGWEDAINEMRGYLENM